MYTLLTSHVYIMVTLLIVPRVASQYFFLSEQLIFVCVLFPISGVFTTRYISLFFL